MGSAGQLWDRGHGGTRALNEANNLSATTVPNGLTVTGTLNSTTKTLSGSYHSGSTPLGSFSLTRPSNHRQQFSP